MCLIKAMLGGQISHMHFSLLKKKYATALLTSKSCMCNIVILHTAELFFCEKVTILDVCKLFIYERFYVYISSDANPPHDKTITYMICINIYIVACTYTLEKASGFLFHFVLHFYYLLFSVMV